MKREKAESANNIWNKEGFLMCGLGEKNKIIARIKYFRKCCRWSRQRIARGYADCDKWNMCRYLQNLIPDMLQDLRDNLRSGTRAEPDRLNLCVADPMGQEIPHLLLPRQAA